MVREAVGIFDGIEPLQAAVDALSLAGFERHELSLMADDAVVRRAIGHDFTSVDEVKDDPKVPRQPYVAPEEVGTAEGAAVAIPGYVGAVIATGAILATGGTALAAILGAAAAGAGGGALGSILARWVGDKWHRAQHHLEKGGILLWVNLRDEAHERKAVEILSRHTLKPVEIHELPQVDTTHEGI